MAGNPVDTAQRARQYRQLAAVPSDIRQLIAQDALNSQKSILAFPYYSTLRFNAALSGAGPFAYTIAAGPRKCFNYKIGDTPGSAAGFPTTYQVTKAETNLLKASETRDNADVLIWGLAIELCNTSDPFFAKAIWRNAYVELALSGTDQYLLGPLTFFPSAGGLYGSGNSLVLTPPLNATHDFDDGNVSNGNPTAGNYFRLPHPVRWEANGSGKKDTSLVININIDQPIAQTGVADRAQQFACPCDPEDPETPGPTVVAPFTHPEDGSVFVDLRVRLISVSISERSTNT